MKRLQFSFDTTVHYSAPVAGHQLALRCVPMTDAVQHLETCAVTIEPAPLPQPLRDGFGNTVYWYSALEPHTALRYAAVGVAAVDKSRADEAFPNPAFRCHGLRTKPGRTLLQVSSAMPKAGTYEAAEALCHAVHSLLQYTPGVTDTTTTAETALRGGIGVCQDYAQVFVALARLAGWSARYCMGLSVGEGATHAWAEIYYKGHWHGFDPTRDCAADERYLRFGVGRDSADCPVEQGIFFGSAAQRQSIRMRVTEL